MAEIIISSTPIKIEVVDNKLKETFKYLNTETNEIIEKVVVRED